VGNNVVYVILFMEKIVCLVTSMSCHVHSQLQFVGKHLLSVSEMNLCIRTWIFSIEVLPIVND